jgi:very-short-patch-repair endonuclease
MRTQSDSDPIDVRIAELADQQYGVVSRRQLVTTGASRDQVRRRIQRGALVPLHRGVYAVGHRRLTQDGFWLAAVFAAQPAALLSHRDAARLHGLGRWRAPGGRIEVTTSRAAAQSDGLLIYSRRRLMRADATTVASIPVTTVARTLVDLADVLDRDRLAQAMGEAERVHRIDVRELHAAAARVAHRTGAGHARLREVLADHAARGVTLTRSELERALAALVRAHGLPAPELNARVGGFEVDALWRAERLAVECDGWEFHRDRRSFQRDRDKANALQLHGWRVLRFTHADVAEQPERVARAIAAALRAPKR